MNETLVQAEGELITAPFVYRSVEEPQEVVLAKFRPMMPLQDATGADVLDVYLNLGADAQGLAQGDRVSVSGLLVERPMVTRSGKIRRGGAHQILVREIKR
ncbi:MAG TPA: hypothetical protein VFV52_00225 [Bacilli bacterium]|nr:hypothetical protein [Bacilli bacterium]